MPLQSSALYRVRYALTFPHRLVITASSDEFAPRSRSGDRALEVNLAEELIKTTGVPHMPSAVTPGPATATQPPFSRCLVLRDSA